MQCDRLATTQATVSLIPLLTLPMIEFGVAIAPLIADCCAAECGGLQDGDIVIITQKIVSRSEGASADLSRVAPDARARAVAEATGKDVRLVEIVLQETREIIAHRQGVLIVEDVRGLVLANAGIDQSNAFADRNKVMLLPTDPDASARSLLTALTALSHRRLAVLVIDSLGRAWRLGTVGTAIGAAGLAVLADHRGRPDMFGRMLESSVSAVADELAAAASLLMGQAAERIPVVIVRGLAWEEGDSSARDMQRPRAEDMFRNQQAHQE